MKKILIKTIITLSLMMMSGWAWAQTNVTHPAPMAVPDSIAFSTVAHGSKVYPTGLVGWQIGANPLQTYRTNSPTADKTLYESATAGTSSNQVYNYNGKIGFLNTNSNDHAIAFAVNTTGKSNITITYDMMTIRSPMKRVNRAVLQYRIGNDGSTPFITIPESEYISSEVRQITGTNPLKTQTFSILLPETCNDQELVQLRFVGRDDNSYNDNRASFAINRLSVKEDPGANITMLPSSISQLNYDLDNGPSTAVSIKLNASKLKGNITVQAHEDFEISLSENFGYGNTIILPQSSGSISETYIYARLKEGLERGSYSGNISFSHDGAVYPTKIFLSGKVEDLFGAGYLVNFEGKDEQQANIIDGKITLNKLEWELNDVTIDSHATEYYSGQRSARLRGLLGTSMTMIQDKTKGLGTLRFNYGRYATNNQFQWKVEYSRDQGATWTQIGDVFYGPNDDLEHEFYAKVNISGNVRIRIVRSGSDQPGDSHGRFNIDNIFLSDHDYDIYPAEEKNIGEDTPAVINGVSFLGANILNVASEDFTAYPNDGFTPEVRGKLELFGRGDAIITVSTAKDWFAWLEDGMWHTLEGPFEGEDITIVIKKPSKTFEFMTGNGDNPTLPVELSSFTVALNAKGKPNISWTTQSETAMNGFYLYRGMNKNLDEAILISGLIPATNSSLTQSYSFEDTEIYENGIYYYWLNLSDLNGHESYLGPMQLSYSFEGASTPEMVYQTGFKSVYPNPFNPSTNIAFELSGKSEVDIKVYNTRGQLVRSFAPFTHDAGHGSIIWDGKDEGGRQASSGIYFFRMKIGAKSYNAKALMLK